MTKQNSWMLLVLASLLSNQAQSATHTFTELGTLGGTNSFALAINNAGQIVGSAQTTGDAARHAVRWNGTVITDLQGSFGSDYGDASAINESGQVAGTIRFWTGTLHATYWSSAGALFDLGMVDNPSGSGAISYASGINNSGKVVGSGQTADYYKHATIWKDPTEMHDFGGSGMLVDSHASAINTAGISVGWRDTSTSATPSHAAMWGPSPGFAFTDLGTLGGATSRASAINDAGQVVGYSQKAGQTAYRATLWNPGTTPVEIGPIGSTASYANAINNAGLIVGSVQNAGSSVLHATLWIGTTSIDLNDVLDPATVAAGWVLSNANDINDSGWIVGSATNATLGVTRGYLLKPEATDVTAFCFGDGSATTCPCGNAGGLSRGCSNTQDVNGALLTSTGTASITYDSFALVGEGMPNGAALYIQGTAQQNGGLGIAFGDGLLCVGGSTTRLGTKFNSGGASQYPSGADSKISVQGLVVPGAVRTYQVWYRDSVTFCNLGTFNLTNGVELTWWF